MNQRLSPVAKCAKLTIPMEFVMLTSDFQRSHDHEGVHHILSLRMVKRGAKGTLLV